VLVKADDGERLYFVVETKSGLFTDDLRDKESAKIECGKAHFKALAIGENPAHYEVARTAEDLLAKVMNG
jgi:type III restriction enzyme